MAVIPRYLLTSPVVAMHFRYRMPPEKVGPLSTHQVCTNNRDNFYDHFSGKFCAVHDPTLEIWCHRDKPICFRNLVIAWTNPKRPSMILQVCLSNPMLTRKLWKLRGVTCSTKLRFRMHVHPSGAVCAKRSLPCHPDGSGWGLERYRMEDT